MSLVPVKLAEKILFFQAHLGAFGEHAAEIGLSDVEVAELAAAVDEARAAATAQGIAQDAARSATLRYNLAVEAMSKLGATAIMKIRTRADSTDDPSVYSLSRIPRIAQRSPIAEPGTPFRLISTLDGNGSLELQWKCQQPKGSKGTTYFLSRSIGNSMDFAFLAITGEKRFIDTTIPPGTSHIQYKIQAVRSTKSGEAAIFPVSFGSGGSTGIVPFRVPASRTVIAA